MILCCYKKNCTNSSDIYKRFINNFRCIFINEFSKLVLNIYKGLINSFEVYMRFISEMGI